jgi:hypothetical protein
MVVYACDPSTQEAEAGRSSVQGQPVLLSETLSKKEKTPTKSQAVSLFTQHYAKGLGK